MVQKNEYETTLKIMQQNDKITIPGLPQDVCGMIVEYKNDLERAECMKYVNGKVMRELKKQVCDQYWNVIMETYWEYEQCYEEWRRNCHYFDPEYTTDLVESLYDMYDDYKHLLIPTVYMPAKMCNCCKNCARRRLDLDLCLPDDCACKGWRPYQIGRCPCETYGCVRVCDVFHNLQYRNLWNERW